MQSQPRSRPSHRRPEATTLITLGPVLCLTLLVAPAMVAADPVYRWVDGDGNVHYADRAVGSGAEQVDIDPMAPADGGANHISGMHRRRKLLNVFRREREQAAWSKAYATRKAETRDANCAATRRALQSLVESPLIYEIDEAGERVYLSNQQRNQEIAKAREAVAAWCD